MLKPGDRVTYFSQDGKVTSELGVLGWYHVELVRGDKVHAPASAFVKVEEEEEKEKPRRWLGRVTTAAGRLIHNVPLIANGEAQVLDTARIAAPMVLERLRELKKSADDKGHSTLCNIYVRIQEQIAALEQEIKDAK